MYEMTGSQRGATVAYNMIIIPYPTSMSGITVLLNNNEVLQERADFILQETF